MFSNLQPTAQPFSPLKAPPPSGPRQQVSSKKAKNTTPSQTRDRPHVASTKQHTTRSAKRSDNRKRPRNRSHKGGQGGADGVNDQHSNQVPYVPTRNAPGQPGLTQTAPMAQHAFMFPPREGNPISSTNTGAGARPNGPQQLTLPPNNATGTSNNPDLRVSSISTPGHRRDTDVSNFGPSCWNTPASQEVAHQKPKPDKDSWLRAAMSGWGKPEGGRGGIW
ncbi:hypothetical protein FB567DRAFT_545438 [Paraphoma chrysanthemicola]|uniref:Uncharacterized protein n=1 Tax=Paraphoma chrysanthemicola TaxID=798071 RepID=A0A8K0RDB2_9PLEO|nr:hypothetical protein FB567DRAFT_545438 [Paraphoma chrysanthemicola]